MGDLVRIKEKFQVTIPVALREQLSLHTGDYLEASIAANEIILKPRRLVESPGRPSLLDFMTEPRSNTRTRVEIDTALSADRDSWDK